MKTILYGTAQDEIDLCSLLSSLSGVNQPTENMIRAKELDDFIFILAKEQFDLVLVTQDGAMGMEAVMTAQKLRLDTPRVWFSNDRDFAVQSYRLRCAYFAEKPITAEKLQKAMERCGRERS